MKTQVRKEACCRNGNQATEGRRPEFMRTYICYWLLRARISDLNNPRASIGQKSKHSRTGGQTDNPAIKPSSRGWALVLPLVNGHHHNHKTKTDKHTLQKAVYLLQSWLFTEQTRIINKAVLRLTVGNCSLTKVWSHVLSPMSPKTTGPP